jgi:hypothetical protein
VKIGGFKSLLLAISRHNYCEKTLFLAPEKAEKTHLMNSRYMLVKLFFRLFVLTSRFIALTFPLGFPYEST